MKVNKAYKFRLYPTEEQKKTLAQSFGSCRFVYNHFLRERIDFYVSNKDKEKKGLTYYDTANMLTKLKGQEEFNWLKNTNSQSLQQSLRCLDVAYNNFFNHKSQFPKFHKKSNDQSFLVPQHFSIKDKKLVIPKLDPIKIILHRDIIGNMKSVNISMTPSGKYYASILCEIEQETKPKKKGNKIGIDLGLKSFFVSSDGKTIDSPKYLRQSEDKLRKAQRLLSRKVKGSNNRNKARVKVARVHDKIKNRRMDFLHKLSHQLVAENQSIFAEDLNIKGMQANHKIAKSVSDSGWSEFIRQLKYKSEWSGVYFGQVDRFFPSSKRCNSCGWINESLTLKDREWICKCGKTVDRDLNAAQNILLFGLKSIGQELPESTPGERDFVTSLAEPRSHRL